MPRLMAPLDRVRVSVGAPTLAWYTSRCFGLKPMADRTERPNP
jgi:hypothetical protein